MVNDPAGYRWSSYRSNGLGGTDTILTPHPEYQDLGRSLPTRTAAYRALFAAQVDGSLLDDIRGALNKGLALGSERFKDELEANLKRRVRPGKMGRPKKTDANSVPEQEMLL